jgi:hypothetical protein
VIEEPYDYCRQIEGYLCRKNDGHLVRIVGPAFEQVCAWASRGVPLRVAFSGIDRYFERYYAKGPRRRPVRVEFCEADILDVFEEWRRAVGVADAPVPTGKPAEEPAARPQTSLPAHLDRVVARLTAARAGESRPLDSVLESLVRELDTISAQAKGARGAAREEIVARLAVLDASLLESARAETAGGTLQEIAGEADTELAPFRSRMDGTAYDAARRACIDRLLRERLRLPTIAYVP